MLIFRRISVVIAVLVIITSTVLLLNFTAPNPTGRRYSSEMPITTGQGNATEIGLSAERVLAKDLNLPRNDDPDQRQCICNNPQIARSAPGSECRVCMAYSQSIASYRRPDFIGANFIAESKNRLNLLYTHTDQVEQIGDYAVAARALGKPLWIYVRVNTILDPEFYRIVESTGGGVVPYFTVPGYVDPVDNFSRVMLMIGSGWLVLMIGWEWFAYRWASRTPPAPKPAKQQNLADMAARKARAADDHLEKARERARRELDKTDL